MESQQEDGARVYERSFLLSPARRNRVELWEVQTYGVDSFYRLGQCLHPGWRRWKW